MTPETVHIKLNPAVRGHLERLAEARNTSLSAAVRWAVTEATFPEGGVPTRDELLRLLGMAARDGSVPAIRELLAHYRREEERPKRTGTLRVLDELRQKKASSDE
jgi:hypothetical protein